MFGINKDGVRSAYPDTFSSHIELSRVLSGDTERLATLLIDPDLVAVDFLRHVRIAYWSDPHKMIGKPPLPDFARYGRTVV